MNALTLQPIAKQMYQVQPQYSHPRVSLRRVLYVRFLRWVEKSSGSVLFRTSMRLAAVALLAALYFAPDRTFDGVWQVLSWRGGRIPLFILSTVVLLCWRSMVRMAYRVGGKRNANQHTFHGVPVGELAQYVIREQSFKQTESIRDLGLSQGQYAKISQTLEDAGVLVRGEKNARVLRDITLEQLVRQLRDGFPMTWSDDVHAWIERNGTYEKWCMSHDFKRRKLQEEIERKERRLGRVEKKTEELRGERIGALADLFSPVTGQ